MNNKQYKDLKRQAEERYQKALELAEKQRIEELTAIETVWRMSHPSRKTNNINSALLNQTTSKRSNYGLLAKAVLEALEYVPETFTRSQVKTAIERIAPDVAGNCKDSSLTGRLIRLVKDGVIDQVKAGKGSQPSEYRKKPTTKPVEEVDVKKDNNLEPDT
jgi:hypothetical protein